MNVMKIGIALRYVWQHMQRFAVLKCRVLHVGHAFGHHGKCRAVGYHQLVGRKHSCSAILFPIVIDGIEQCLALVAHKEEVATFRANGKSVPLQLRAIFIIYLGCQRRFAYRYIYCSIVVGGVGCNGNVFAHGFTGKIAKLRCGFLFHFAGVVGQ